MKVFVTAEAENDLLQIYAYVAERNPEAAEDLRVTLRKKSTVFPFFHSSVGSVTVCGKDCEASSSALM